MASAKVNDDNGKERDKSPQYVKPAKTADGKPGKFSKLTECTISCDWGDDQYLNVDTRRYPPAQCFADYDVYLSAVDKFADVLKAFVVEAREDMPKDAKKRKEWLAEKRKDVRDSNAVSRLIAGGQLAALLAHLSDEEKAAVLANLGGGSDDD